MSCVRRTNLQVEQDCLDGVRGAPAVRFACPLCVDVRYAAKRRRAKKKEKNQGVITATKPNRIAPTKVGKDRKTNLAVRRLCTVLVVDPANQKGEKKSNEIIF